jgi:glycosyltransferase involved in cell wall biosynthesis
MREGQKIGVVIPACDEERAIGLVLSAIPKWVDCVVVVDNGSRDRTGEVASAYGVHVVSELSPGYGSACLAGIAALEPVDIIVFVDGDNSDYPGEMAALVDPILRGEADMTIGSRVLGQAEPGSLSPQQRWGNWLATALIRAIWGVTYSDLGPFRAITRPALSDLHMRDRTFGWTVEMQIKAAEQGLKVVDVPVRYRKRIGRSKISGTVKGVILAGYKILSLIAVRGLRHLIGMSRAD